MNTSFEKAYNSTDEWYTPREIIDALGPFDLDPCAPLYPLWRTATIMYDKHIDGLSREWKGRVWLNPPYSRPLIERFVKRLAEHGNGIALLFNRCDSGLFHEQVFDKASAMLFMRGRIRFFRPDGSRGNSPGCGSILVAYGENNTHSLERSGIPGHFISLTHKNTPCIQTEIMQEKSVSWK